MDDAETARNRLSDASQCWYAKIYAELADESEHGNALERRPHRAQLRAVGNQSLLDDMSKRFGQGEHVADHDPLQELRPVASGFQCDELGVVSLVQRQPRGKEAKVERDIRRAERLVTTLDARFQNAQILAPQPGDVDFEPKAFQQASALVESKQHRGLVNHFELHPRVVVQECSVRFVMMHKHGIGEPLAEKAAELRRLIGAQQPGQAKSVLRKSNGGRVFQGL